MDGTQIRIFQQSYQISLHRLLQSQYRTALEMNIWIVDLSNLPYQSLKRHSSYEKLRRLLVPSYFSQHYGPWEELVVLKRTVNLLVLTNCCLNGGGGLGLLTSFLWWFLLNFFRSDSSYGFLLCLSLFFHGILILSTP